MPRAHRRNEGRDSKGRFHPHAMSDDEINSHNPADSPQAMRAARALRKGGWTKRVRDWLTYTAKGDFSTAEILRRKLTKGDRRKTSANTGERFRSSTRMSTSTADRPTKRAATNR